MMHGRFEARGSAIGRPAHLAAVLIGMALAVSLAGFSAVAGDTRAWAAESADPQVLAAGEIAPAAEAVELNRVEVTGGIGGAVGVGDTLTATAYKVKTVSGTTSTVIVAVDAEDGVSYQWQYANTASTADASFTDIEGATSETYVIGADMEGKYLRVKAMGKNEVVSTKKPYYGTTQSVSPLGPVQAAVGAVQLDSVSLVSTLSNSMWVGATVTPTAQYLPKGSYIPTPAPQDAHVTYTWEVADSASGPFAVFDASSYPKSSVSPSGELTIGEDLLGKFVRLKANALINTVSSMIWPVLPLGVYDLLRITFGFDTLYTGNTIVTTLQGKTLEYENDASFGTTVSPNDPNTTYQWYSTADEPKGSETDLDFSEATWTPVEGATDADLVIPESVVGCYVKVVATSSKGGVGTSVERASTTRVMAGGSLQQALEKMEFFHPTPKWNVATNMNDIVADRLASMGYTDVQVRTKSFERSNVDDSAHLNVSTADDETNGDVEFFTYDDAAAQSTHNFSIYHQVKLVFELARAGEDPVDFSVTTNIPWNLDEAQKIIEEQMADFGIGYEEGDSAAFVTRDLTLPCKAGILWATWASDNKDVVKIYREEGSADSIWDPYTGQVKRGSEDVEVVLTANVDATLIDSFDDSLRALNASVDFPITVRNDADLIGNMNALLKIVVDDAFIYDNVKEFRTGKAVDKDALDVDLQLPGVSALLAGSGLNSGEYRVVYSTDNEAVMTANGQRTNTTQPLPGMGPATVDVTATVSHRNMPVVSYEKSLEFSVAELDVSKIDAEIAYLGQVEEALFEGYSEGKQEQNAVTADLHPFQRAYFTDDGELRWKYAALDNSDKAASVGFTPQTVDDRPSSDASYARFVSSMPQIIADDTLHVTRYTRDIGVSITCCLTSDRFGAYYERYKDDPDCPAELKDKFAQLYRQKMSCLTTVKGTQVSSVVRDELLGAADDADAQMEGVIASEDGTDVAQDAEWVDPATMDGLKDALMLARAIATKETATDAEIANAHQVLSDALTAFQAARKPGTHVPSAADDERAAEMLAAADDAEALLDSVYVSLDGTDIPADKKWVSLEAADRLADAVAAVRSLVASGSASDIEMRAAVGELALARAAFERGMVAGLMPAPVAQVGKTYAGGSGAAAAAYQVKSAPSSAGLGTVLYAKSRVAKAAKSATVPATVRIGGSTYKVVGISSGAFKNLKKLKTVTIGANVKRIAKSAFKNTPKLKKIVLKGTALKKKASVKGALKGSKARKLTVKVPAKAMKAAKKVFTKKNLAAPKAVKVK